MDRKVILLLLIMFPCWCFSQKKKGNKMPPNYIKKNESDMKKYAASIYYGRQLTMTDTTPCVVSSEEGLDPFVTEFFNNSHYQYPALLKIMDFADKMAGKQYRSAGRNKCYCFETMLDFHNSAKLDSVVQSFRKYLDPPEKE